MEMDPILEYVLVGMYGAVIVWLAFRSIGQGEAIVGLRGQMSTILENQTAINAKLDEFLKNEMDQLKELVKLGFSRNKG